MKKYFCTFCFALFISCSFAQTKNNNSILIRHDTTLLRADECEWIIKSLVKNDTVLKSQIKRSVPQIMLESIEKGKLTAMDPVTNKPIPAKAIFTWQAAVDSVLNYDNDGNAKLTTKERRINADNITQIRIYQDWYFDLSTGKFQVQIKWIELLQEIYTSSTGLFIGYSPYCSIYY